MYKSVKLLIIIVASLAAIAASLLILLVAFLSALEYRPAQTEDVAVRGSAKKEKVPRGEIKILSWNIGYADLGDYADFFMDNGKHVQNSTREQLKQNLAAVSSLIKELSPDAVFLQEVDLCSTRSFKTNEASVIQASLEGFSGSFAYNFNVPFLPYPLPPIGKVESGLFTLSTFVPSLAERISLPVPFKWPVRTANLKRCLLASRIPVEGGGELVLVNLHLEAFDSGEGKIAQTKSLRDFVEAEYQKGNYVIAGGDFNQTFSNTDISSYYQTHTGWKPGLLYTEDFPAGWTFLQDPSVPTCRSNREPYKGAQKSTFQFFCIDGFILSPNVRRASVKTLDLSFEHSDHNPILLTCELESLQ